MIELIQVELYKMMKKKYFQIVLIFNCISFLYGLGIYFNWGWVSFHGKFDLIQYMGAICQLFFLIGLPLIFFMYLGAGILGGEKADGQILLEITGVADRKMLVTAKTLAVFIMILFYFITNIFISTLSYALFVRRTVYASPEWIILDYGNMELLASCLFGCVYIIFSACFAMYLSIRNGAVTATIAGSAAYAAMSLITRIPGVRMFVPGCFALTSDVQIKTGSIIWQVFWCSICIWFFVSITKRKICNTDF